MPAMVSQEQEPKSESLAPNGWPASLLRGFRDGERGALLKVYRLYAEEVARTLRSGFSFRSGEQLHRFVGYRSAFEFQDALQETFRRAFEPRAREGYDGLRPYGPYLNTIARNIVLKTFRRNEVLFPAVDERESTALRAVAVEAVDVHGPESSLQREQVRQLVQAFLAELDETDRTLMELRFQEGLSQRDVAERLGLGRQRVRTREDRLKARFVKYLNSTERDEALLALLLPLLGPELFDSLREVLR